MDEDQHSSIFNVDVMQNNGLFNNLHTILKITECTDNQYLSHGKAFGKVVASTNSSGIRKSNGNNGNLHTYGMHCHNGQFESFAGTYSLKTQKPIYKQFVDTIMKTAESYFPVELATMIQSEYARGITSFLEDHPCYNLPSQREGPCSISTSTNFATPQHVDVCDGSISIFSWFHIGNQKQMDILF